MFSGEVYTYILYDIAAFFIFMSKGTWSQFGSLIIHCKELPDDVIKTCIRIEKTLNHRNTVLSRLFT